MRTLSFDEINPSFSEVLSTNIRQTYKSMHVQFEPPFHVKSFTFYNCIKPDPCSGKNLLPTLVEDYI